MDTMLFRALVLRLLAQILIKVHAGACWGAGEDEVLALVTEAGEEGQRYGAYVGDRK